MTDAERNALRVMYELLPLFEAPTGEQIASGMAADVATCEGAVQSLIKAGLAKRQKASVMLTKKGLDLGRRLAGEQQS